MTKQEIINLLNVDLRNEYIHLHFYLLSVSNVRGLHRAELKEFFTEAAESEMKHIIQFTDLIIGLGGVPEVLPNSFPKDLTSAKDIVEYAIRLEQEVVDNYSRRMQQAKQLESLADACWIEAFLENQIVDSRTDLDNLRMML